MTTVSNRIRFDINDNLINEFLGRFITEEFIRKLVCITENKSNPHIFKNSRNQPPFNFTLEINIQNNLFSIKQLKADRNSLDPDDITEKAAVGVIISFFLTIRPNISNINVILKNGGYDYVWYENGKRIKIEVSGVNTSNRNAFYGRIYEKNRKFKKKIYAPRGAEEFIGIVDFYFYKYRIWKIR